MVAKCKNLVLAWLVRDGAVDQCDEEEDWDQEEEGGVVMIRCMWEQEEYYGDDGRDNDREAD